MQQSRMRWEGGMRDASEEREDNKPLRGLVFQTILRRLIVSLDLYFHFSFMPSFWDKIHFHFL